VVEGAGFGLTHLAGDPQRPHELVVHAERLRTLADELDRAEYVAGVGRLERLVRWLAPAAVCVVGLTGWRVAVDRTALPGVQPEPFGGRPVYLMGSTSGLNAHATPAGLADDLRAAAALAGR
jgi:TDG/mug DNA glycosylase family protein